MKSNTKSPNNRVVPNQIFAGVELIYLNKTIDLKNKANRHVLVFATSGSCELCGPIKSLNIAEGYIAAISTTDYHSLHIADDDRADGIGFLCCVDIAFVERFHERFFEVFDDTGGCALRIGNNDAILMPITSLLSASLVSLMYHFYHQQAEHERILEMKLNVVLMSLISEYDHYRNHLACLCNPTLRTIKERLKGLLLDHVNADVPINAIAEKGGFSPTAFKRLVRDHLGLPPRQWINKVKLEKSLPLLRANNSVARVSHEVGFESQSYFSVIFKREYGMTPKKYQKCLNAKKPRPSEIV